MLSIFYSVFLFLMITQGILSIYLVLYIWEDPQRLDKIKSPKKFKRPSTSFTVLIPARNEQKVIAQTIQSITSVNYPKKLIEVLIICEKRDTKTIQKAEKYIKSSHITNAKVLIFDDEPINKPHGLNKGLWEASNKVIAVFDAEDEVNKDIFNVANTLFLSENPDVIQAGVQLMNYDSHWFSAHNVLEYYFWFKSRMHFHTKVGVVPLGGNTVFFKTKDLKEIGGWDETCLTEDAEIGIRLSVNGAHVLSTYDPLHITKEETPGTIGQFIKQRTRWNQGFIQVLKLGHWKKYNSYSKQIFCIYTLSFPIIQAFLVLITPILFVTGLIEKFPVVISLLSFIPILLVFIQFMISTIAMREFINEQKLFNNRKIYFYMLMTFLPYQLLLGIGALRASYREVRGLNNWEKTIHSGAHRKMHEVSTFEPGISI